MVTIVVRKFYKNETRSDLECSGLTPLSLGVRVKFPHAKTQKRKNQEGFKAPSSRRTPNLSPIYEDE